MPSPVYSTRFAAEASFSSSNSYSVPDGFVWVVTDIDVQTVSGGSSTVFQFQGSVPQSIWVVRGTTTASQNFQWRGRAVFYAGEAFAIFLLLGVADFQVSGFQLTAV